jgi:phosphoribosylpyrophosphate synthetase
VIVARNPGSAKKATSYAERLRVGIAVIHGEVKESESDEVDGRYSPPVVQESEGGGSSSSAGGSSNPEKSSSHQQQQQQRRDTLKGRIMDVGDTVHGMPSGIRKEKPPLTGKNFIDIAI